MLSPAARLKVISRVKSVVLRRHFNFGNVDYAEWLEAVDKQTPALIAVEDTAFEQGVEELLGKLKSSHTAFLPPDTNPTKPQYAIGATLRPVTRFGARYWLVLDVFDDGPAARAGISPGHLLLSVNGIPIAPPTFPTFKFGEKHTLVVQTGDQTEPGMVMLTVRIGRA